MSIRYFPFSILFVSLLLSACHERSVSPNENLELSDIAPLQRKEYRIDASSIRSCLSVLAESDKGELGANGYTRSYYEGKNPLMWINRIGVDERADSLVAVLRTVEEMGFDADVFRVAQIERDLNRVRTLNFSEEHTIHRVMARLEYNLTRAYLGYTSGQRFGFVNPEYVLNRLDPVEGDSTRKRFRRLYGIPMRHADEAFYAGAIRRLSTDSLYDFLRESRPSDPLYYTLLKRFNALEVSADERKALLCNMERCRWNLLERPKDYKRYVFVNIPNFYLYAVDENRTVSMRVGCGTNKTKTPLLTSKINLIQLNPKWVMPGSIVKKDVLHHVGDADYFNRHNYYIYNTKTGERVSVDEVTHEMLLAKEYKVAQEGGRGNALGRIIFRFPNDFSVYLHHTSTPGFFSRDERGVSHGCVRVEEPFELAKFLLKDKDEEFLSRLYYSMTTDLESPNLKRSKLLNSVNVSPEVPLFISYYTVYPDSTGTLRFYRDVYGYDSVIYDRLEWRLKKR